MAEYCVKCKRKIGIWEDAAVYLDGQKPMCIQCAQPIEKIFENIYKCNLDELNSRKEKLLEICEENFSSELALLIIETFTKRSDDLEKRINSQKTRFVSDDELAKKEAQKRDIIDNYMLTTGYDFDGYNIAKYIGVISGQVVLGTGFLSEFTASFADFFGVQSDKFATKLEEAKNAAVEKLIIKSAEKGGNAIIGVDFDYITFHGNMIGVVANGTSVVVEKEK